ncbi:MAG: helix-turn-helix domain-containing protein [Paludibacteraceae bacterium]|nr:helix-turn-helix domain-containing protein [Paludibacteraceae bacterium]MBQ9705327.1 helix-turn-helix domain-containing protein [Paludibacteraceae bacterium]
MKEQEIPLLDCPIDFLIGDASGKIMNEYARYPCKIKCGVYAFMLRGTARATLNITEMEFKQNDLLVMESGTFLHIHEFSEDALVYYILFSSSFLEKYAYSARVSVKTIQLENPKVHLSDEMAGILKETFDLLLHAINCSTQVLNPEKMVHILNLLQLFYADYVKQTETYQEMPKDRKTELYHEYNRMVLENYQRWHHVAQYAEAMRISLPHLCSTIKAVSGKTASDLINDAILVDAKAQLKLTTLQVKEIALSLGFDNVAFFNRFFKSHTGMTPKTYRSE